MVEKHPARKLNLFGVALDPTDDELKLQFKSILSQGFLSGRARFRNPYEALTSCLQDLIDQGICEKSGEIGVASWLTPTPSPSDLPLATVQNNLRFLDGGGCHEYACRVGEFLKKRPAGSIPAMIAVDHSMTGGAIRALVEEHGSSSITMLVVDSHFDGLLFSERMDLFRYGQGEALDGTDRDSGSPSSVSWRGSTAIRESYNCATWLRHLLDDRVVKPERLIVFGVSDYPTEAMRKNPRLSRHVDAYLHFERTGVPFVTKEEIRRQGVRGTLEPLLNGMATDRLYLSLDVDIGSLDSVHAARFMNVVGLASEELYQLARVLEGTLQRKELIGFDVSGIETFLLGREFPNGVKDRTLERVSDFVRILLGQEAMYDHLRSRAGVDRVALAGR